jgi:putative effector of murein hydrolase
MSLKAFHIVFVTASIILAFGFGGWSFLNYKDQGAVLDLVFGIGSVAVGIGLVIYERVIMRKLKDISYL